MVARRSGRGFEPADDRNTGYRSSSRSSRGNSRYDTGQRGTAVRRASRVDGRTRPATRRPYHDTFYEDMLTDGMFDQFSNIYSDDQVSFADGHDGYDTYDASGYDETAYYDDYEETPSKKSAADYSRGRYGSRSSRNTSTRSSTRANRSPRESHASVDDFDYFEDQDSFDSRGADGLHPSRYSSLHAADRYRKPSSKSGFVGKKNIILAAFALIVVLLGGCAFAYANGISNNLQQGIDDDLRNALVKTDMANEPFYMLLLGTDGSLDRQASGDFGDMYRSDSIMLVRIDPVDKKVALVSISRDILVDLGEYGEQKLNAAYGLGGPALTVKAVSKLTGVDISHYAQVDFDGFSDLVDALGGVTVDVPVDIDDDEAGGRVRAGEQLLNGDQALILCRSRNTYTETAAQPDAMRAANQRLVMSALAHKLLDADIATIASSVEALSTFVSTDLSITDIIGLAQTMKGLDSSTDIYTAMAPTKSQYIQDVSVDYIDKEAWKKMMQRLQQGLPPTEEAQVDEITGTITAYIGSDIDLNSSSKYATVVVKNGTERQGLANQTRNVLLSYGFKNVIIGDVNTNYTYPKTLVIYEKDAAEYGAQQIAKIIEQGKVLKNDGQYLMSDAEYVIIIGDDWV